MNLYIKMSTGEKEKLSRIETLFAREHENLIGRWQKFADPAFSVTGQTVYSRTDR
jgi:hypothetical protein